MRVRRIAALTAALGLLLTGCSSQAATEQERLSLVTTTGILADLSSRVAGDRWDVTSIVPPGADPHTYEPTLRDIREIVYADAAFSNYALLESHAIIRTLDANIPDGVPNVAIVEASSAYSAEIIPMVENISLDTIWLGMRVNGTGEQFGADRASEVHLEATNVEGPGELFAYITGAFGQPVMSVDSSDGFDGGDVTALPPAAHTHMSWAFTEPGVYELTFSAQVERADGEFVRAAGEHTVTFAVGVNPSTVAEGRTILEDGHTDVSVELDDGRIALVVDTHDGGHETLATDAAVISVPTRALHDVPADPTYRFLGDPGTQVYQLPQAVLGAHVHGEIDPHLWMDVKNAQAYVRVIRDTLIDVDPDGSSQYHANADATIRELDDLDREVRETLEQIPEGQRHLVTTHDAYAYLANAYGLSVAGFVSPNPDLEPSLQDRVRLSQTLIDLDIPAVFLEPTQLVRSSVLVETADQLDIDVCPIYGDTFDDTVTDYFELMRFTANSIHECLTRE